jgi:hypothetical protein
VIEDKSDEAKKTKVCAFTFYHVVDYVVALPYYTNYATFDQANAGKNDEEKKTKVCDFAYHVPALSRTTPNFATFDWQTATEKVCTYTCHVVALACTTHIS